LIRIDDLDQQTTVESISMWVTTTVSHISQRFSIEGLLINSRFHQLHCVASIRRALQDAKEGRDIGVDQHDNAHWPHCLDYLRQASFCPRFVIFTIEMKLTEGLCDFLSQTILCFADDTMEQQDLLLNGTRSKLISGKHDIRKCRPREHLYTLRAEKGVYVPQGWIL
jgi:hypothetical protein